MDETPEENTRIVEYNNSTNGKIYHFLSSVWNLKIDLLFEILEYYGKIHIITNNRREMRSFNWYCKKCSEKIHINECNRYSEVENIIFGHLEINKFCEKIPGLQKVCDLSYSHYIWSCIIKYKYNHNREFEEFETAISDARFLSYEDKFLLTENVMKEHISRLGICGICMMIGDFTDSSSNVIIAKHAIEHIAEFIPIQSLKCHKSEK